VARRPGTAATAATAASRAPLAGSLTERHRPWEDPRGQSTWAAVEWQEIAVGDIVVLRRDEAIPADILLLRSSDERGICYVETASLDGEVPHAGRQRIR